MVYSVMLQGLPDKILKRTKEYIKQHGLALRLNEGTVIKFMNADCQTKEKDGIWFFTLRGTYDISNHIFGRLFPLPLSLSLFLLSLSFLQSFFSDADRVQSYSR